MRLGPATPLADILEADWQKQVEQLAKTLGWRLWHNYNARRSDFGWPDLALCRERFLLAELKREKRKLTDPQKDWMRALLSAGVEAYILRPSDLTTIGVILAARNPLDRPGEARDAAVYLMEKTRKECT
jgi:hypothetical protein